MLYLGLLAYKTAGESGLPKLKSLDPNFIAEDVETAGQLTLLLTKGLLDRAGPFSLSMSAVALFPQLKRRSVFADAEVAAL